MKAARVRPVLTIEANAIVGRVLHVARLGRDDEQLFVQAERMKLPRIAGFGAGEGAYFCHGNLLWLAFGEWFQCVGASHS